MVCSLKMISWRLRLLIQRPPNTFFSKMGCNARLCMYVCILFNNLNTFVFGKCFKKTTEYFLKFFFYLKVQSFRLILENNFIQMAASAGNTEAYTIAPIFKHIIDCVQLYFTNGFTNIVL